MYKLINFYFKGRERETERSRNERDKNTLHNEKKRLDDEKYMKVKKKYESRGKKLKELFSLKKQTPTQTTFFGRQFQPTCHPYYSFMNKA